MTNAVDAAAWTVQLAAAISLGSWWATGVAYVGGVLSFLGAGILFRVGVEEDDWGGPAFVGSLACFALALGLVCAPGWAESHAKEISASEAFQSRQAQALASAGESAPSVVQAILDGDGSAASAAKPGPIAAPAFSRSPAPVAVRASAIAPVQERLDAPGKEVSLGDGRDLRVLGAVGATFGFIALGGYAFARRAFKRGEARRRRMQEALLEIDAAFPAPGKIGG